MSNEPTYSVKISEENRKAAYRSFVESVAEEEGKIKDWIGRSMNGPPRLFIRK